MEGDNQLCSSDFTPYSPPVNDAATSHTGWTPEDEAAIAAAAVGVSDSLQDAHGVVRVGGLIQGALKCSLQRLLFKVPLNVCA